MDGDRADRPDRTHRRPEGVSDEIVEALGALSKALETTERARGHLYGFHQLTGAADLQLDRAVELLRQAGRPEWADKVRSEILGRNVIPGHWTFQIVEAYDATYYRPFSLLQREAVEQLAEGRDHLYEAEMKEARRTAGHPDHTARPAVDPKWREEHGPDDRPQGERPG
ncbi:hypothetical protein [Streptomyces resistomycificus]|uniref:Uncharacterized protein n=1 Tax=Streptomyces resistomycificus TaxID=67356 RepID=A0A0L8LWR5_9ACTN|nr:hypothetical protein [Streptomyces resistomycificus]KOG42623.1 hypothetical protein ADK37_04940 [Streptomyces resistomycificus]KUN92776.1 hypothetical protein AQJ84_32045 [Streptomyces resistomycificus]